MWFVRVDEWKVIDWFTVTSTVWPMGLKIAAVGAWIWQVLGSEEREGLKRQ